MLTAKGKKKERKDFTSKNAKAAKRGEEERGILDVPGPSVRVRTTRMMPSRGGGTLNLTAANQRGVMGIGRTFHASQ